MGGRDMISRAIAGVGVLLAVISFSMPSTALAQDGALAIEEIVVTARKRAENLQHVPIAITVFTTETIERAGIERPADFISLMPNVTIVDTANVGDTQVSIRGIVSTRDAESTFAYVVDGILSTNPNSFNEELVDVQQIEDVVAERGCVVLPSQFGHLRQVHPILEKAEVRQPPLVESHDLSVQEELLLRLGFQLVRDFAELLRHVEPVATAQLNFAVAQECQNTESVQLGLEDPPRMGEGLVEKTGHHRLEL